MSPTTRLKVSFTLDLGKLNYARELRGLDSITLFELQDHLAKEGAVQFLIGGQVQWYNDERELRWNVI